MTETVAQGLEPRFADGSAMRLVGLIQSYDSETMGDVPAQWRRFAERMGEIQGRLNDEAFGLHYARSRSPLKFDYLSAVMVSDDAQVPSGMVERRTVPRRHAVFTHRGHVSELPLHEIVNVWLPGSGCEAAGDPLFVEVYGEGFDPRSLSGTVEIWLAIKE